jgi:2-dehydropantoate 2-reductase
VAGVDDIAGVADGRSAAHPEIVGIVGAGALGTLLATCLAGAANAARVVVLARGEVRTPTLRLEAPAATVVADAGALRDAALLFLCVKSYQTEAAVRSLSRGPGGAPGGPAHAPIVSLQNGWGHMEIIERAFPAAPLVAGTTTLGAYWDERGSFHASIAGLTTFAPWTPTARAACERAVALFERAGLRASTVGNARDSLWRKLVLNVAVNPVTAIHAVSNGALLAAPRLHELALAAAREAVAVGAARGHLTAPYDPAPLLDALLLDTAANRSSMAEDVARGRSTEADAILGAIAREGAAAAVPTPVIASLAERLAKLASVR